MIGKLLICLSLVLCVGCSRSTQKQQNTDTHLRYTVFSAWGAIRSSRNRDSVMKTDKMTIEQIRTWAKESPVDEARLVDSDEHEVRGPIIYSLRNDDAIVSSVDEKSLSRVLKLSQDEIREWVKDAKGAAEHRYAVLFLGRYVEVVWRDSLDQLLYSVTKSFEIRTSRNLESAKEALALNHEEARAWAEDESAIAEGRSVILLNEGGVSHGRLPMPPWLPWRK